MKSEEAEKSQIDIDWEKRTLCSDESCIGVIGQDGRCKECGLPFVSELSEKIPAASDLQETDPETVPESGEDAGSQTDIDWEKRSLCSDESCIGVIGPDGRCKECGLPFAGE